MTELSTSSDSGNGAGEAEGVRSRFVPSVLGGLAGAGALAMSGSREWVRASLTGSDRALQGSAALGDGSVPVVSALGLVLLATWGALLVTRGWARRVLVVLGLVAAFAAAVAVGYASFAQPGIVADQYVTAGAAGPVLVGRTAWNVIAVLGTVLTLVSLSLAWFRLGSWPEMASRYDSPGASEGDSRANSSSASGGNPRDLWSALDRGDDPTVDDTL